MIAPLKHAYSDGIYNKSVAILGNYPPPLGGVSVHIQRVMHKFKSQGNKVHDFDTSKRRNKCIYLARLIMFMLRSWPEIIYYHTVDLNSRLVEFKLLVIARKILGCKLVLVEHNCRHMYTRGQWYKKKFNNLMQAVDHLVMIGYATQTSYQENNIMLPANFSIEAAFLPPNQDNETIILATYPNHIFKFLKSCSFIITANAFQCVSMGGKDLYGLDLTVRMLGQLKKEIPDVGLIIALAREGDSEMYQSLLAMIEDMELNKNILFVMGQKELWPLIKRSDLFVRPTLSDAESVSVQEALFFNVPVIASDACVRPKHVITFKTGDIEDFYAKINHCCDHLYAQ